MRRIAVPVFLSVVLAAAVAGAGPLWIDKEQLALDPADPAVLRFTVEILESGSYQVRLLVRGESEKKIELRLDLQPESGGPAGTVHFSFTGRGCG